MAPLSISDPRGTALVVHIQGLNTGGRLLIGALPQSKLQRLNALTMVQFPFSVFVETGSIAISF